MQVDAMSSVTSRIAQIQARIASISGAPLTVLAPSTAPSGDFTATLAKAAASRVAADQLPVATAYPAAAGAASSPWSAALGSTAPGSTALGSTALGSTAPGSTALGSTAALTAAAFGPGIAALGPTGTGGTTAVAGLGPVDVPPELAAYGNGRIPASALSPIGGSSNHMLWAPAARAYEQMTTAAARAGVTIGITDSYRTYAAQVDLAERKGLHSQGGLAATPGKSDHGWGKSVDLRLDGQAQAWMSTNAAQYGFTENVSREPWHWTYRAD